MKNNYLKRRPFSLLIIIILFFSLQGCGDDNNDPMTFLEKYDDTSWKFNDTNTGGILYARINNNEINPFEIWLSLIENSCFIFDSIADDGNVEVLENTESKFEIKVVDNPKEFSIITLVVNGSLLTAVNEDFEDGISVEKNIFVLLKTSDDLSDLDICAI